ncbi:helix-turn-helix domain-containing protein [Streptomyces sp. R-74717]|uniref:helix-turn-helix domain-containing protein n=1 Tax=Streptomyces sp. R-74717 TaxID=2969820 RepID=UPI0039B42C40
MTPEPRPRTQITDPTGQHVAANVRRVREARGWSTYDLSRLLGKAGRPIAASAIAKVERAERRVDVGDLAAMAVVLGVSPSALLLPLTREGTVSVTGAGEVPASTAWEWADGERPLVIPPGDKGQALLEYTLWSRPRTGGQSDIDSKASRRFLESDVASHMMADSLEAQGMKVERHPDGTLRRFRVTMDDGTAVWSKTYPPAAERD